MSLEQAIVYALEEEALLSEEPHPAVHPTPPDMPRPSAPRSTDPAGLTARELEVLRLVAQGLSDREAAQQLVVSPRTINAHLTSIYSKLGVSSRAAATRFALDHHLV